MVIQRRNTTKCLFKKSLGESRRMARNSIIYDEKVHESRKNITVSKMLILLYTNPKDLFKKEVTRIKYCFA